MHRTHILHTNARRAGFCTELVQCCCGQISFKGRRALQLRRANTVTLSVRWTPARWAGRTKSQQVRRYAVAHTQRASARDDGNTLFRIKGQVRGLTHNVQCMPVTYGSALLSKLPFFMPLFRKGASAKGLLLLGGVVLSLAVLHIFIGRTPVSTLSHSFRHTVPPILSIVTESQVGGFFDLVDSIAKLDTLYKPFDLYVASTKELFLDIETVFPYVSPDFKATLHWVDIDNIHVPEYKIHATQQSYLTKENMKRPFVFDVLAKRGVSQVYYVNNDVVIRNASLFSLHKRINDNAIVVASSSMPKKLCSNYGVTKCEDERLKGYQQLQNWEKFNAGIMIVDVRTWYFEKLSREYEFLCKMNAEDKLWNIGNQPPINLVVRQRFRTDPFHGVHHFKGPKKPWHSRTHETGLTKQLPIGTPARIHELVAFLSYGHLDSSVSCDPLRSDGTFRNVWKRCSKSDIYLNYAVFTDKISVKEYSRRKGVQTLPTLHVIRPSARTYSLNGLGTSNYVVKVIGWSERTIVVKNHTIVHASAPYKKLEGLYPDEKVLREMMKDALSPYNPSIEKQYKFVRPSLIVEPLLRHSEDLKFLASRGNAFLMFYDVGRFTGHTRTLYSCENQVLHKSSIHYPNEGIEHGISDVVFSKMKLYAASLSQGFSTARVDFYQTDDQKDAILGELTFTGERGDERENPLLLGDWLFTKMFGFGKQELHNVPATAFISPPSCGERKKAFITGVLGFIGFHLASELEKNGYCVWGIDTQDTLDETHKELVKARQAILSKKEQIVIRKESVCASPMLEFALTDQFDVLVHLAARPGVRRSTDFSLDAVHENVDCFSALLETLHQEKFKGLFLYASSSSVYGKQEGVSSFREDMALGSAESVYASTKQADEALASAYAKTKGVRSIGLRFFTVYGGYGRTDMAAFSWLKQAHIGEPILLFKYPGVGSMKRDFTHVSDIVRGIHTLAESHIPSTWSVVNIGNGNPISIELFLREIGRCFGRVPDIHYTETVKGDVPVTWANTERMGQLGWTPNVHYTDGVYRTCGWYRAHYNANDHNMKYRPRIPQRLRVFSGGHWHISSIPYNVSAEKKAVVVVAHKSRTESWVQLINGRPPLECSFERGDAHLGRNNAVVMSCLYNSNEGQFANITFSSNKSFIVERWTSDTLQKVKRATCAPQFGVVISPAEFGLWYNHTMFYSDRIRLYSRSYKSSRKITGDNAFYESHDAEPETMSARRMQQFSRMDCFYGEKEAKTDWLTHIDTDEYAFWPQGLSSDVQLYRLNATMCDNNKKCIFSPRRGKPIINLRSHEKTVTIHGAEKYAVNQGTMLHARAKLTDSAKQVKTEEHVQELLSKILEARDGRNTGKQLPLG